MDLLPGFGSQKSIGSLFKYDLAIIAKPTQTFSDSEKQVLDNSLLTVENTLWLVDQVSEMDSLYNSSGSTLAYPEI
jgi:hypothetical protein